MTAWALFKWHLTKASVSVIGSVTWFVFIFGNFLWMNVAWENGIASVRFVVAVSAKIKINPGEYFTVLVSV